MQKKGIPVTTSLMIAETFGKLHKNVMQSIETLDCTPEFRKLNFELSSYEVIGNSRSYPMYEMTRDGFTFLALGFTGKRAAQFKEAYINEFNRMEAFILENQQKINRPAHTDLATAARKWAEEYEGRLITNKERDSE